MMHAGTRLPRSAAAPVWLPPIEIPIAAVLSLNAMHPSAGWAWLRRAAE